MKEEKNRNELNSCCRDVKESKKSHEGSTNIKNTYHQ